MRPVIAALLFAPVLAMGAEKSPSVSVPPDAIRYYTFSEGKGHTVRQWAGDGVGELLLVDRSPFGEPHDRRLWLAEAPRLNHWHAGRLPGTFSLQPSDSPMSVVHSLFYETPGDTFALETWVRPREGSGPILYAGDAYSAGYALSVTPHNVSWKVATKSDPVWIDAPPLKPGLWHHVVAEYLRDEKLLRLYVDGVLAGEKSLKDDYAPPQPVKVSYADEESDWGGLRIGGRLGNQSAIFDIDELAVYPRSLTTEEIRSRSEAGRPAGTEEEQLAAFTLDSRREAARDAITFQLPDDTMGYFTAGRDVPLTFHIPATSDLPGNLKAIWQVQDLAGKPVASGELPVTASETAPAEVQGSLRLADCGLYFLTMQIVGSDGLVVKEQEIPIGIIVDLPTPARLPERAPLAAHGAIQMWPEASVLGFGQTDRIIMNVLEPKPGEYDFTHPEEIIEKARAIGMEMMFCLGNVPTVWTEGPSGRFGEPTFNLTGYRQLLEATVRHFKGRVKYWEILNEPNGGHYDTTLGADVTERAKNYVSILKIAHDVIRKEDPDAKIVAISGAPGFIPWMEAVLAAGGAPYFDIVTIHNYHVAPIQTAFRDQPITKARALLEHYGKDAPVWNGEFGIKQPARVDGRPMPAEELFRRYVKRMSTTYGYPNVLFDMPVVTEALCAAWNAQSVLLDLGAGAERVCILAGANRYFPQPSASEGTPSEKGVAMAAVARAVLDRESITMLPLASQRDAGVLIKATDGTTRAAIFSEDKPTLYFRAPGRTEISGMDWLGNPRRWPVQPDGLLKLTVDERPVYLFDIPAGFAQVPFLAMEAPDALKDGALKGELILRNPTSSALDGTLKWTLPSGMQVEAPSSVSLQPGQEMRLPFTLTAGELKRGTHEFTVTLHSGESLLASTQHALSAAEARLNIPRLSHSFTPTADPADWKDIPAVTVNDERNLLSGKPLPGLPWAPQWKGPGDLTLSYRLAWDAEGGLAFLVEVTDDVFRAAPDDEKHIFRYDCLELFVDFRPDELKRVGYSPGAAQFLIGPPDSTTTAPCRMLAGAGDSSGFQTQFVGRRTAQGYVIEGRVKPPSAILAKLTEGSHLALDLFVDDSDELLRKAIMGVGYGNLQNATTTNSWGWFRLGGSASESAKK